MENQHEIAYLAIDTLGEISHLEATFQPSKDDKIDGFLTIKDKENNQEINLSVEIKTKLQNAHIAKILLQNNEHEHFIVIAESIIPDLRKKLRALHINYLEITGNAYIKYPNVFYFVENNKINPSKLYERNSPSVKKTLTKNGLKLVFHLLEHPALLQTTYRRMSEVAQVSLDTVHKTIQTLKNLGFIIPLDDKKDYLSNIPKLFERWVIEYDAKLKPTLYIGKYRSLANVGWKDIVLDNKSKWGGEAAAEILTDYLRATNLTLYTEDGRSELVKKYRLVPDNLGNIDVFHSFAKMDESTTQTVSPLLVYADLINSTDYRNQETAQKIHEKFIQNKV